MTDSPKTQAILLLTTHFTKRESGADPLTPAEYGRFAEWLKSHALSPEDLLNGNPSDLLSEWHDKRISGDRISALLNRGAALALSMEKWSRSGLWVMLRSCPDYPKRLKLHLKKNSPAVLFGCGNRALVDKGGLAVVGSRSATKADLDYSREVGAATAGAGVSVVSGGAEGVDSAAMFGALNVEGTVIGVLANNLLRACSSAKYRGYLQRNDLVLVSPVNPEAGFNVGNAMRRNKYVYCLSDAALAVHSDTKGGTWNGAQENLKYRWSPLWVKKTNGMKSGNAALIAAGASEAPEIIDSNTISKHISAARERKRKMYQSSADLQLEMIKESTSFLTIATTSVTADKKLSNNKEVKAANFPEIAFYELFVAKSKKLCADGPRTVDEMAAVLDVNKSQIAIWLKQAVEDGELKKQTKPVRYVLGDAKQKALSLK